MNIYTLTFLVGVGYCRLILKIFIHKHVFCIMIMITILVGVREFKKLIRFYMNYEKFRGGGGTSRNSPLDEKSTKQVKELVKKYPCCDYITLASSLFFSSKLPSSRENFFMEKYYNKIRITDYDEETVKRFHQGLEIVREDYRTIVEGFAGKSRVVYIMDPPYLSTDVSTYSSSQYWKLKDHLDIVSIMHSSNAIYFTSDKSNLIELNQWLVDNKYRSFFSPTAKICTVTNNLAKHISYKDYMIVDIDTIKQ